MPKVVDHAERRRRIADGLLAVAAERGLESVTVRQVAAAVGVSPGMVQHYFGAKDEMMAFALDVVQERVRARLEAAVADDEGDSDGPAPPIGLARVLLRELLPRDRRTRDEASVTLAFLAYAAVHPTAGETVRADTTRLLDILTEGIERSQLIGDLRSDLDARATARSLLALVDGLGLQVLTGSSTPDQAIAAFDATIALLAT